MLPLVASSQRLADHARRWIGHARTPLIATGVAVASALVLLLMTVQHFYGVPLTVRVKVGPDSKIGLINRDTGCYRWRLPEKLNRTLNHTRAVLLENGRPLSRVMHVAEVEDRRGAHFMVRGPVLRFAAGDASDVRTNGRRYELVAPRPVREHWFFLVGLLLALSLPLAQPVIMRRQPWAEHVSQRLPVWSVAAVAMLTVTVDLMINPDRTHPAFLVKGLPESDAQGWFHFATTMNDGRVPVGGFSDQRPLYAVMLAAAMEVLGPSLFAAKALNVLLLGLTAAAIFALSRALRHPWAGLGTVAFLCLSFDHLHQWHKIMTENAGLAFAATGTLALVWALLHKSVRGCLLAGVIAGLGNLAAGHILLALPLVAALLAALVFFSRSSGVRHVWMMVAFVVGATMMLLPWMALQKHRHGVFTISLNSAELLAGAADPVHGKLSGAMLGEAHEKGFTPEHWQARYGFFMERFKRDVAADPFRYFRHVLRESALSVSYLEMEDETLHTLLVLALIAAGVGSSLRWGSAQPLLIASSALFIITDKDLVLPGWFLLVLASGVLLRRWGRERLLILSILGLSIYACMAVNGLAGNVATRRFWLVMDWAIVLLALAGVGSLMHEVSRLLAKVPVLGFGMEDLATDRKLPVKQGVLSFAMPLAVVMTACSLLATAVVWLRMGSGPRVVVEPARLTAVPTQSLAAGQRSFMLYFDDHVMHLDKDEDVAHWLPNYQPVSAARWLAFPRLIKPDGTLGGRVALEKPAKSDTEVPRWQAAHCVCQVVQRIDPLTAKPMSLFQVEKIEVLKQN